MNAGIIGSRRKSAPNKDGELNAKPFQSSEKALEPGSAAETVARGGGRC